jgi:hypothetical protein
MRLEERIEELTDRGIDSVETFVQYLLDDGQTWTFPGEVQALAGLLSRPYVEVLREIKEYGVEIRLHPRAPTGRGFTSNDHDRWTPKNGAVGGYCIGDASRQMVSRHQPT